MQSNCWSVDASRLTFGVVRSPWEIGNHNASVVGSKIAEFAMGSLITMIDRNRKMIINGTVPHLGSRLNVHWGPFVAILVCIVATHFVVFALTYWLLRDGNQ